LDLALWANLIVIRQFAGSEIAGTCFASYKPLRAYRHVSIELVCLE
jgi:hypothetical protein